jgi:hypothetical protein
LAIQAKKAIRRKLNIKMALISPSGGGKTYSSLRLCKGMGGKTLLVNTEGDRGYIYADEFDYDIADIEAPFTPEKFIEAIEYGEKEKYDNIIIDSASHEWSGKGGLLEVHSSMPGNSYTNWAKITPRHNKFIDAQLYCKANIISCLRGKDTYVLEEKNGKQVPQKVGLGADQRAGYEYECMLTLMISQDNHVANPMKDNTHIFDGKYEVLCEEHGELLRKWADTGEDKPVIEPEKIGTKNMATLHAKAGEIGMSHEELSALAQEKYKVGSLKDLTVEQGRELYLHLSKLQPATK